MPQDAEIELVSRTVGLDSIVDEFIFKCTHTLTMDFFLPGVAPTGKRIEVPHVAIIQFRDGLIESEHIYWDQVSVLVQTGLLQNKDLPVAGVETAHKILRSGPPVEHSDYAHNSSSEEPKVRGRLTVRRSYHHDDAGPC